MEVLGLGKISKFVKKHPQAKGPLKHWVDVVRKAQWEKFADIRDTYNSADLVKGEKNKVWFNISGNKYRLKAIISYTGKIVITECVLTHAEYSKR